MSVLNDLGQPVGAPLRAEFPRPLPPHSALNGRYCRLVPLDAATQAAGLHAAYSSAPDDRGWTYLPHGPFATLGAYSDWLKTAETSRDPLFYTVLSPDDRPLGTASYLRITPDAGVIEVGFINFSHLMQGTRTSTEAMFLMMAHVFDDLGYRRYEWKCDDLNAPSRRAAERLGFSYEGTFRQATHYKGRNRDTAWYAMLDGDWPAAKGEFQRWLDPANFAADGQQMTPLKIPRERV